MAHPDDDVQLNWRGPFAFLFRPLDRKTSLSIATASAVLAVLAGAASLPFVFGVTELEQSNRAALGVVAALSIFGYAPFAALRWASTEKLEWLVPTMSATAMVTALVVLSASVYFAGPTFSIAVYFVEAPTIGFLILRRPYALGVAACSVIGYGCALIALKDPVAPVEQMLSIVTSSFATALLIGGMAQRFDQSRTAERDAKLGLRRFLAPQVADVVTSGGAQEMLAPHRRHIAVFFVDLRGFTAFTNSVTPERVMTVLEEYYASVGAILDEHNATIGGFDGDGVFAYVGDPVPTADPAGEAIAMAKEIAGRLDELTEAWSAESARIGYGIGLAYGEATLGLVGFASRSDYTPVGACVNLAARLCADAKHGEIVIDDALRLVVPDAQPRASVVLKGFGEVATFGVMH